MYQSPDFVKVNLAIKDNYAAYQTCIEHTMTNDIVGHCDVVGDPTYDFTTYSQLWPENVYQCYTKVI